jgi:hypothetical protein
MLGNTPHLILFQSFISLKSRSMSYEKSKPPQFVFSIQFNLVFPLSKVPVPYRYFKVTQHLLTSFSSSSCHFYPSFHLSFNKVVWKAVTTQGRSTQLGFILFTVCSQFLFSLTLCNISSFLTWSVQQIFTVLLQSHISKHLRYFWSNFRSTRFSEKYKAMLQM